MAAATAAAVAVNYSRLKLLCILEGPGAAVLFHALTRGTNKTAAVTLLDYLTSLRNTSKANYCTLSNKDKRKAFNRDEEKQIANDPSCQSFDITLLHKSIRLACENVAGLSDVRWQDDTVMEGLLTKIKDERNKVVHERPKMTDKQFLDKAEELKNLFIRALQAVKDKYGVSDAETTNITDIITSQIQEICQAFDDNVILQMSFEKKLHLFKQESVSHLREIYKQYEYFDPVSFLSESSKRVHIQTVFSKLVLKQQPKSLDIDLLDILKYLTAESQSSQPSQLQPSQLQPSQPVQDKRPRLAVVSGVAGSGKTTLLTFILSEWLKEESDRRVTHLEEYDIVLRMLCRDTDAEDLETFLGLVLPPSLSSLPVFNASLVNYLKHCKVLFLIDGLDEQNSTSKKLITKIVNTTKYNKNFSILTTSRPERVNQFLALTQEDYNQLQISIKGIPVHRRMQFAEQYCTSTNKDRVKEFMREQGNKTLFELPLNIIFLVTLFEENPNFITKNITPSILYTKIHEWCIEKLRVRISKDPTWGEKRPQTLKMRIKRVVKEMYQVALQSLLQDRVNLSDEDTERLTDCCEREDLPPQQVLGAFFTLQLSITKRICEERYSMHHKGMLEYFAARHIMQHLQDGSLPGPGAIRSLLETTFHSESLPEQGVFRRLLQGVFQLIPQYQFHSSGLLATERISRVVTQPRARPLDPRGLQNLFWHVAGLLTTEETNHPENIKEVIDLLAETGAGWDEWLSLVEDIDNESFLQAIAHHVTKNPPDGTVQINDNTLTSAAALLPNTPTTTVELWLENEKVNVENVRALIDHHCRELCLWHHYWHPGNITASDTVLRAIHRDCLERFMGHLSADCMALIPECLRELRLAVSSDEHAASLPAALTRAASSLPNLQWLFIHVPVAMVTPAAVPSPLPDITRVDLILSGVNKSLLKEACQVAAALQPTAGYGGIGFPQGRMKAAEWRDLLYLLAAEMVRVGRRGAVVIPEETITWEEGRELEDLTGTLWGCRVLRRTDEECFHGYYFVPNS
ncbi:uncharacterized protein LOC135095549 isoform X2 [Scylla paramamosain]|uniref:uncharacterized protein LOC135095549 isoform X2 n=1 Tax=Scylla paramamosain TaxID=85552 RepID=UPI003082BC20